VKSPFPLGSSCLVGPGPAISESLRSMASGAKLLDTGLHRVVELSDHSFYEFAFASVCAAGCKR
jgi:hypothetical protein